MTDRLTAKAEHRPHTTNTANPAPLGPDALRAALAAARYVEGERFEVASIYRRRIRSIWSELSTSGLRRASEWLAAEAGKRANPQKGRATDTHCGSARILLLDVDPTKVRQKDVDKGKHPGPVDAEGTAPEKIQAAAEVADQIRELIREHCGCLPSLVSSGRGRQVWLAIEGERRTYGWARPAPGGTACA